MLLTFLVYFHIALQPPKNTEAKSVDEGPDYIMVSWDAVPSAPFYSVGLSIKRRFIGGETADEVLKIIGPADRFMLSPDKLRYSACISNSKRGASCDNIPGYTGPSINTRYDPGQEVKYRVGACANNVSSSCSFAEWKAYSVPGDPIRYFVSTSLSFTKS